MSFAPLSDAMPSQEVDRHHVVSSELLPLLEAAVHQAFNAVVVTDANQAGSGHKIVYCNPAFCAMTGYSEAELLGQSPRILQGAMTDPVVINYLRDCLQQGTFFKGSTFNYRKDGSAYLLEWNISPVRDAQGTIVAFVSVQQDVTEIVKGQQRQALLAQALNATEDAVAIFDVQANIIFCNHAFELLTGYCSQELLALTPLQAVHQRPAFYRQILKVAGQSKGSQSTYINRHKNGHIFHIAQTTTPIKGSDGEVQHYVCVSKDISDIATRTQELYTLAHRDALTGVLNRRAGEAELSKNLLHVQGGSACVLMLFDIDHFKFINDTYGHDAGDLVLKDVADALESLLPRPSSFVRWGGEEFLAIIPDCTLQAGQLKANQICEALAQTYMPATAGYVTVSIGLVQWSQTETSSDVLRRVDKALYRAKHNGRNCVAIQATVEAV